MAACVLDASMAAAWWLPDESTPHTEAVLDAVSASAAIAPRLWAYELRNIVLLAVRRQRIGNMQAAEVLADLRSFRIVLADPLSYDGVFTLAADHGLTFYDAAYLDLAIREGLPLASLDKELNRAAAQAGVALFQP